MRVFLAITVLLGVMFSFGEQEAQAQGQGTDNVSCTFTDGKQISFRYQPAPVNKHGLPEGHVYTPGDAPMLLFTQTPLTAGTTEIPAGAFSVYIIPGKKVWTLIINKNVAADGRYDEKQDLARLDMQVGKIETPATQFQILFAHVAPKQCNMRVYSGTSGAWAEFKEK